MTTVDILMPYYGDVSLMRTAVRSVLAQDDPDWRLTVVDDGTEPGVPEWFAEIGDDRVRYRRNEHNLGVTGNFNRCLDLAEHDLLTLLGSDDELLPNYVRTVRAAHHSAPDAAIIQPGVEVIDSAGRRVHPLVDEVKRWVYAPRVRGRRLFGGQDLAVSLLRGDWLYFPSLCWRTRALDGIRFRRDLRVIQDLALLLQLVARGERLLVDDTRCFRYRRHGTSESATTAVDGSRFAEAERYFAETAAAMRAHGWPRAAGVARRRISSRLFALTLLPGAIRRRAGVGVLARHAFGPLRPAAADQARNATHVG